LKCFDKKKHTHTHTKESSIVQNSQ